MSHALVPRSAWRLPIRLACGALLALGVVLAVDSAAHYPQGLITWHWLRRHPTFGRSSSRADSSALLNAAPSECWWDYEAAWSIGVMAGSSPVTLQFPASPAFPSASSRSASSFSSPSFSPSSFSCADVPVTPQRRVTFVADPFLVIPPSTTPSARANASYDAPWFLFFEQKNVALTPPRGELAVAESRDMGRSWRYVGEVLSDPGHLSYPFVLHEPEQNVYVLIPETHEQQEVRLYTTSPAALPVGWTFLRASLTGAAFVDTSAVYVPADHRWYIFTTVANTLLLYHTDDLLAGAWVDHPASPLSVHDRAHGRSAGRPVLYDGVVHRFAQQQLASYGEGVRVMRVERLSPTEFAETEVAAILPSPPSAWPRQKLHHVDAVSVLSALPGELHYNLTSGRLSALTPAGSSFLARFSPAEASLHSLPLWIAVVDGDNAAEDQRFWEEEGWLVRRKRSVLLGIAVTMMGLAMVSFGLVASCVAAMASLGRSVRGVGLQFSLSNAVAALLPRSRSPTLHLRSTADDEVPLLVFKGEDWQLNPGTLVRCHSHDIDCADAAYSCRRAAATVLVAALKLILLWLVVLFLVSVLPTIVWWRAVAPSHPSMLPLAVPAPDGGLHVVTAASSVYFDRVSNFVGSMHTFAAGVPVLIYDLGLSDGQREQMAGWQDVSVVPFPFHLYPQHVRNLFSYAWKLLIFQRAFVDLPDAERVIVLDSGLELRSHSSIRRIAATLSLQGYWFASQPNTIDRMAHPDTVRELNVSWAAITGKQFCAGGLSGWRRDSDAYQQLMPRALDCALREECILPVTAGHDNHRHDQVVMSSLLYATGRHCDKQREWREWDMTLLTEDEAEDADLLAPYEHKVWIAARRWHQPKPYIHRIARTRRPRAAASALSSLAVQRGPSTSVVSAHSSPPSACLHTWIPTSCCDALTSLTPVSQPGLEAADKLSASRSPFRLSELADTVENRRCVETVVLSTLDQTKMNHDHPLRVCLHRHDNSRWSCRALIQSHLDLLAHDAHEAQFVAQVAALSAPDARQAGLTFNPAFHAVWQMALARAGRDKLLWLTGDLILSPMARRLQHMRYHAVVLALCLLILAVARLGRSLIPSIKV